MTDLTEAEIEAARVAVLAELGQIDRTQPWGITDAEAVSIGRAALLAATKVRGKPTICIGDPTIASLRRGETVEISTAIMIPASDLTQSATPDPTIAPILAAIREALTRGYTGQALSSACSPANMKKLLPYVDALTERNRILGESVDAITAQAEDAEGRLVASRVARERVEHEADNLRDASIRSGNEIYALRTEVARLTSELDAERNNIERVNTILTRKPIIQREDGSFGSEKDASHE